MPLTQNPFTAEMAPPSQSMLTQMIAPDVYAQQIQLARQQQIADILRQQSLQDNGGTQVIGGWAIPNSPLQGISKIAEALGSTYAQKNIDNKQLALAQQMQKAYANILGGGQPTPNDQPPANVPQYSAVPGSDWDTAQNNSGQQAQGSPQPQPSPQPAAPSGAPSSNFALGNLLKGGMISSLGGYPAANAYWKQFDNNTPFVQTLRAAGIDPSSPQGQQLIHVNIEKQNLIPLVAGRAGAPMYRQDGSIAAMAPKIPDNAVPQITNGQVTGVTPLPGAAGVIQSNAYAGQAGKAQAEPIAGYDSNGQPVFTNKLAAAGGGMAPSNNGSVQPGQGPQGAFVGDPNAIRSQINRISDPAERAAATQALNSQMGSSQPGDNRVRPGLAPGFNTFQDKVAGTSADLASKTLTIASTAPQRINILDNILDLSKNGVATGPGADFQNSVKGYIANTPGIAGMFPKGWQGNVADYQELTKFMNQNASQAWQAAGGTGSDAQLEMQTKANVNNKMFPQALQGVAQWAKAGEMAAMSKANLMQKTQAMQSPQALQQFEMQWRNNFDPKVFQLQIMSPEEQQAFVKRLQPGEAANIAKKRAALMQMGAF